MADHFVRDVTNAKVHPGAGGSAFRLHFEVVAAQSKDRQSDGSSCTLTMLRADAERLLNQLHQVLNPPSSNHLN
jgi:hypothetical protein